MRRVAFYLLLLAPIIVWAAIVLPSSVISNATIPASIVYYAVSISPIVGGDVSLFGEITPIVLAGAIIALASPTKGVETIVAAIIAVVVYGLFVHLSIYFSSGAGVGLISSNWEKIAGPQKTILGLVSNIRVMSVIIAASIVGIQIKNPPT